MKRLRVTAFVDSNAATEFFDLLANSPSISEARLLDWNVVGEEMATLLYAIDGDPGPFRDAVVDLHGIESVDVSAGAGDRSYVLVNASQAAASVFDCFTRIIARGGLVVRKPIIYRDSEIHSRVVGDPAPLQAALEQAPDSMTVRIDEIGTFRGESDQPASILSERQQTVLSAAVDMGYYEQPRSVTHEDIAAELECAPVTVSDHLQKAEAKLVRAVMDDFGPNL